MRLSVLASGSGGNALLIETSTTAVYVDAGLRRRRLSERRPPGDPATPRPSAVLLTHEHADHVAGADDLAAEGLRLYATRGTARAAGLTDHGRARVREIRAGEPFDHGDLRVLAVPLPHDAAEPVAYVISDGRLRLGVLTDCGFPCPAVARALAGCDALVLETNHDPDLLRTGPYPPRLKARIRSDEGHLGNDQSATLLRAILDRATTVPELLICAHLSKANNRPELARSALAECLPRLPIRLLVAEQDRPLPPLAVRPALVRPALQLALPLHPAP